MEAAGYVAAWTLGVLIVVAAIGLVVAGVLLLALDLNWRWLRWAECRLILWEKWAKCPACWQKGRIVKGPFVTARLWSWTELSQFAKDGKYGLPLRGRPICDECFWQAEGPYVAYGPFTLALSEALGLMLGQLQRKAARLKEGA